MFSFYSFPLVAFFKSSPPGILILSVRIEISFKSKLPVNDIRTDEVEFSHEAKIGKISDKAIFYLMSRGLSEEDAKAMIVRGFAYPISKELPVEYAVEMNNLINLELEGAIG